MQYIIKKKNVIFKLLKNNNVFKIIKYPSGIITKANQIYRKIYMGR